MENSTSHDPPMMKVLSEAELRVTIEVANAIWTAAWICVDASDIESCLTIKGEQEFSSRTQIPHPYFVFNITDEAVINVA